MQIRMMAAGALATLAASTAHAQDQGAAGHWRVDGKVSSFAFGLNCTFAQAGERLTGECVDASTSDPTIKGGRRHPLTAGSVMADKVGFTYGSSFLLTKFDVVFNGVRAGDRMSGGIDVQGRKGTFTAVRN